MFSVPRRAQNAWSCPFQKLASQYNFRKSKSVPLLRLWCVATARTRSALARNGAFRRDHAFSILHSCHAGVHARRSSALPPSAPLITAGPCRVRCMDTLLACTSQFGASIPGTPGLGGSTPAHELLKSVGYYSPPQAIGRSARAASRFTSERIPPPGPFYRPRSTFAHPMADGLVSSRTRERSGASGIRDLLRHGVSECGEHSHD